MLFLLLHSQTAYQSEVTEFCVAIGIDEDIGGLEIPVQKLKLVEVVDALDDLKEDVLLVIMVEDGASTCC